MQTALPSTFFTEPAHWRWWIVLYFFIGGIAGGSFFIASILYLFGRPVDRPLVRLGYYVAFVGAVISGILLIVDLTRPLRFWHMLFESETGRLMFKYWSPMSVGAWGLLIFGVFATLAALGAATEDRRFRWEPAGNLVRGTLGAIVAVVGGVMGFFLAGYTGVLLAVTNRPVWADSSWLGILFLFSAASTAAATLVLLAPVWLVVSLLIKLDSRGPVLYRQERVGMDGRIFLFLQFRTMRAGADDREHREYQRRYIQGQPDTNMGDSLRPVYKLHTDPRVTRTGRWLRRTSLDELPQLLNVLRGDMSVVGPRPPIPYEVEAYELWHRKRLDMKPGMTGLWQVSGRNRLSFDEMVRLDLFYIENWSLWLDLRIMLRTIPVLLRGEAY